MNGALRICPCLVVLANGMWAGGCSNFQERGENRVAPVARRPAASDPGFPRGYVYLGNYPCDDEGGYKDALQGVAHDEFRWYFSNNHLGRPRLFKLPIEVDLARDVARERPEEGIYTIFLDETPLAALGYDHFGDIDCRDELIYAPVDGNGNPPVIAVFHSARSGGDFRYIGHDVLAGQKHASWCAINPVDGCLYSSGSQVGPGQPVHGYHVSVSSVAGEELVELEPAGTIGLRSGVGAWNRLPAHPRHGWQLRHMQGGAFSRWGHLYLVNGYGQRFDRYKGGIWVFDVDRTGGMATLVDHSYQEDQPGTFTFEFHPGAMWNSNEPEGIDIWDLDADEYRLSNQPGGQIHVIMIDNYPDINSDDLYFKHYTTTPGDEHRI